MGVASERALREAIDRIAELERKVAELQQAVVHLLTARKGGRPKKVANG